LEGFSSSQPHTPIYKEHAKKTGTLNQDYGLVASDALTAKSHLETLNYFVYFGSLPPSMLQKLNDFSGVK